MIETYYVVKLNTDGIYLLSKPNEIMYTTKNINEAKVAFNKITNNKRVQSNEDVYTLVSLGHYITHPKTLRIIDKNIFHV